MIQLPKVLVASFVFSALVAPSLSFADTKATETKTTEAKTDQNNYELSPGQKACQEYMKERWKDWSFGFGLSYLANNGASAESAFTGASLTAPTRDIFGFQGSLIHHADSGLDLGFKFFSAGTTKEDGSAEGRVWHSRFGGYIGYRVFLSGPVSIRVGSALGFSGSYVSVFSTPLNGKKSEYSGYVEPSVRFEVRATEWLSLATDFGYAATFARSESAKGGNLGIGVLAPQGFEGAFMFVIGKNN